MTDYVVTFDASNVNEKSNFNGKRIFNGGNLFHINYFHDYPFIVTGCILAIIENGHPDDSIEISNVCLYNLDEIKLPNDLLSEKE